MPYYLYGLFLALLIGIIFIVRILIRNKRNTPTALLTEALRYENNGLYEKAVASYEAALEKVKKIRSQKMLKDRLVAKLKVLHTIIEYEGRNVK
jgi:hypothetical protein